MGLTKPFAFMAGAAAGGFTLSYNPFAIYDAFDTDNSVNSGAQTWSTTISTGSGDSTFDTDYGAAGDTLPTWNSNGYWVIDTVNLSTPQGEAFKYSSSTGITDPFSHIVDTDHTMFAYYRPAQLQASGVDVIASGTTSGAVLLMNFNNKTRAHVWATGVRSVDDTTTMSLGTWYIIGQRLSISGGNLTLTAFTCPINGTITTNSTTNAYQAPSSAPYAMGVGGRGYEVRANMDICNYTLYRSALSDAEIQTVCNELSSYYGEPT